MAKFSSKEFLPEDCKVKVEEPLNSWQVFAGDLADELRKKRTHKVY